MIHPGVSWAWCRFTAQGGLEMMRRVRVLPERWPPALALLRSTPGQGQLKISCGAHAPATGRWHSPGACPRVSSRLGPRHPLGKPEGLGRKPLDTCDAQSLWRKVPPLSLSVPFTICPGATLSLKVTSMHAKKLRHTPSLLRLYTENFTPGPDTEEASVNTFEQNCTIFKLT